MRSVPFLLMTSLSAMLSGCSTEPAACPDVLAMLTASIVNASGQPLSGLSVTDTARRTGAVLHVLAGSPADTLAVNGSGLVPIFPESARATLAPGATTLLSSWPRTGTRAVATIGWPSTAVSSSGSPAPIPSPCGDAFGTTRVSAA